MIRIEDFIQLKAFARQDGLLLSLLWTASFALIVYMPASAMGNILAITTPLFVAWRLRIFREYALGGIIGMAPAFLAVAMFYILVLVLCICLRKRIIERPLVRILASILLHD